MKKYIYPTIKPTIKPIIIPKKIAIIGAGGFAREITCNLKKYYDYFVHMEFIKKLIFKLY